MSETGMTIGEASKILSRMKFRVGTDDLNTTIRMCEENEAIDVVLKYCFDLASMCNKNCPQIVRCKDCKHGSLYCAEDVCGETLIECNRPDLGDVIEIHGWKWFCADGERKEGR